ncbi:hypothetical protein FIM25_14865 [Desulfobotulus mexicanus]|uniref:Uncharacterized protein n=1 Tax=Desulfobotulus mexicanus TaxID=2586642 RepID=A0A5S5MCN4_9BACT|nr:hypothetical protein FIM25_14865 [Desulfobotulus mexicanus]
MGNLLIRTGSVDADDQLPGFMAHSGDLVNRAVQLKFGWKNNRRIRRRKKGKVKNRNSRGNCSEGGSIAG